MLEDYYTGAEIRARFSWGRARLHQVAIREKWERVQVGSAYLYKKSDVDKFAEEREDRMNKMHTVTVKYPKDQDKHGNFGPLKSREKKFSNPDNARAWAKAQIADIEADYGNRWPTTVLLDDKRVEFVDNLNF